jgi:hypothetical protein
LKNTIIFTSTEDIVMMDFSIYHGNENEIKTLFAIANGHHPLLKFTYEYAQTSMNFLDVNVYKGKRFENNATLDLKKYFKPTNSFMFLHRESCHSRHASSKARQSDISATPTTKKNYKQSFQASN